MQPYKCPVCDGRGFVPNGFYNTTTQEYVSVNTTPETCRSCGGTGVVWSILSKYPDDDNYIDKNYYSNI